MDPSRWAFRARVTLAWTAAALATNHWIAWHVSLRFSDVGAYETIARAAPSFPTVRLHVQHAERFPAHWLVGGVADAGNFPLHAVYYVAAFALLAVVIVVSERLIARATDDLLVYVVAVGLVITSPYLIRFVSVVPGQLADVVFVGGVGLATLGLVLRNAYMLHAGVLLSALGRQNAVLVGLVLAVLVFIAPVWRTRSARSRAAHSVACAAVPLLVLALTAALSRSFSRPDESISDLSILGTLESLPGSLDQLPGHVARTVFAVLVPLAFLFAGFVQARRFGATLTFDTKATLVLAGSIVVQTLLLNPAAVGRSELRHAALAIPLLVAGASGLFASGAEHAGTPQPPRARVVIACIAVFAGSLHHLLTNVGVDSAGAFVALAVVSAIVLFVVLAAPRGLALAGRFSLTDMPRQ